MIIAAGFGGLYYRNCINQGVLPVIDTTLYTQLQTGDSIQVDHEARYIVAGYRIIPLPALSPSVQAIIDAGGLLPMLRKEYS